MDTKFELTGTPSELMQSARQSVMMVSLKTVVAQFSECAGGSDKFRLQYEYKAEFLGLAGKPFVHFSIDPV